MLNKLGNLEVELRKRTHLEGDADKPEAGKLHVEDVLVQRGHLEEEETLAWKQKVK